MLVAAICFTPAVLILLLRVVATERDATADDTVAVDATTLLIRLLIAIRCHAHSATLLLPRLSYHSAAALLVISSNIAADADISAFAAADATRRCQQSCRCTQHVRHVTPLPLFVVAALMLPRFRCFAPCCRQSPSRH